MRLLVAFFSLLLLAAGPLRAQEDDSALPANKEPDPFGETLPLIPEQPAPATTPDFGEPDLPQGSAVRQSLTPNKPSETRVAIEQQQRRLLMRRTRVKAEEDPKLQELLEKGNQAPTDAEKRYYMKAYYDQLYARMLQLAPTLKQDELDLRKNEAVSQMNQDKLRASSWTPDGGSGS